MMVPFFKTKSVNWSYVLCALYARTLLWAPSRTAVLIEWVGQLDLSSFFVWHRPVMKSISLVPVFVSVRVTKARLAGLKTDQKAALCHRTLKHYVFIAATISSGSFWTVLTFRRWLKRFENGWFKCRYTVYGWKETELFKCIILPRPFYATPVAIKYPSIVIPAFLWSHGFLVLVPFATLAHF